MLFNKVLFPEPEPPAIPIISAVFNFRLMLFKIFCLLWEIVKSRIVNKDMIDLPIYYLKSKSAVIS